ncbi:MAG: M56 family metallopeptidase [Clostridia bacterium]
MTRLFEIYLTCSITMAAVVLLWYFLVPLLGKRYRATSLYLTWIVMLLGFLLPLRWNATPAFTLHLPSSTAADVTARINLPPQTAVPASDFLPMKASVPAIDAALREAADGSAIAPVGGVTTGNGTDIGTATLAQENSSAALTNAASAARIADTTVAHSGAGSASGASGSPASNGSVPAAQRALDPLWLAAFVWLLGACVALARSITRHLLFLRTVRRWFKPITTPETLRLWEAEKRRLAIRQPVRLLLCPTVSSPMLVGLFHPRLLLPDEELSPDELPLVFRHELTHLRRGDLWIKIGLLAAMALHWFNPAVYLLSRALNFWQETSCDEAVTAGEGMENRRFYSETIIRVIRRQSRMKTSVSTSFYAGKTGMKRRIITILAGGSKRAGALLCTAALALTAFSGMAFAIETTAAPMASTAYIANPHADGAPLLGVPSVNDLDVPIGAFFNGTPVTILEQRESSSLKEWGSRKGEPNWANVLVGGDGISSGISGWVPLFYITKSGTPPALPTGVLVTDAPSGHVNLFALNAETSTIINAYKQGLTVTVLGRVQKWYQVVLNGTSGFVPRDNVLLSDDAAARLETFKPTRFDSSSREEHQAAASFAMLYAQKVSENGGKELPDWTLADKAWYGQMEENFGIPHEYYYQLPQAGDLQQADAIDLAWQTFVTRCGLKAVDRGTYHFNLSFYSLPEVERPKEWEIKISQQGQTTAYCVRISSPSGAVVEASTPEEYLSGVEGERKSAAAAEALAAGVAAKGAYDLWPLADKAAFSAQYGDGLTVLPSKAAITEERAIALAKAELIRKYDIPDADLQGLSIGVDYRQQNDGNPRWLLTCLDAQGNLLAKIALDAMDGQAE